MKIRFGDSARALISLAMLTLVLPRSAPASTFEDLPEVDSILARTLDRARWVQDRGLEQKFGFQLRTVSEKFRDDGTVAESEESRQLVQRIDGHSYSRLIEKDGRPLTEEEERKQDKQFRAFRRDLTNGETPDSDDEDRVRFNEELVGRFHFTLLGIERVSGRTAYVLSFEPRSGDLPVRNRIDRALNESEGRIWIDTEVYEVSRVEFSLRNPIKIWWGFIGNISEMRGAILRAPVGPEAWMPTHADISLNGRILFSSLNQRQRIFWSDFEELEEDAAPKSAN